MARSRLSVKADLPGNHTNDIVSIDFFTVPTVTCRVPYVFLVLNNARRKIIHFNVTTNPNLRLRHYPSS